MISCIRFSTESVFISLKHDTCPCPSCIHHIFLSQKFTGLNVLALSETFQLPGKALVYLVMSFIILFILIYT